MIQDLITQGPPSSRIINFVTDDGSIHIGKTDSTRFVIYYSINDSLAFNVSGFDIDADDYNDRQFTLTITGGSISSVNISYLITDKSQDITPVPSPIDTEFPLSDAVQIDLKNAGKVVIGRIWIFDVGSVRYEVSSSSGSRGIVIENGAVISKQESGSSYMIVEPNVYSNDNTLMMRIIQYSSEADTTTSGGGTYKFVMQLDDSFIREKKANTAGRLYMQIYGEYKQTWIKYFTEQQAFEEDAFNPDTLYLKGDKSFSLTHSICSIEMEVLG